MGLQTKVISFYGHLGQLGEGGSTVTWAAGRLGGARFPPSAAVLHPFPRSAVDFPSLGSSHPRRSNHPADLDRLTWREASHFIVAIATEDGSERKKKGPEEGIEDAASPGAPLYSPNDAL